MSDLNRVEGHAFISYVREDSRIVDLLQRTLEEAGIPVWRDTASLWPGEDWRIEIRRAITNNALAFIACFSRASVRRSLSYQNEELILAIEQLRLRPPDASWLIPVRLDECEIPDWNIGGGRTLAQIQRVDVFGDNATIGTTRLVAATLRILKRAQNIESSTRNQASDQAVKAVPHPDQRVRPAPDGRNGSQAATIISSPQESRYGNYKSPYTNYKSHYMDYTPQVEGVVFSLEGLFGGLVVYADSNLRGRSLELIDDEHSIYANVVARTINGQREYAAVFSSVLSGNYWLQGTDGPNIRLTIFAGQVAEIDLRDRSHAEPF